MIYRDRYFALGDVYKLKDFATALNQSTAYGGLTCFLSNQDVAQLVTFLIGNMKERLPTYRKELVKYAGIQDGTFIDVLNPKEYIDLRTGQVVRKCLWYFLHWQTNVCLTD